MINIDEGKQKRVLEKETLFGKARKGYTVRITGEQTKVPTFVFTRHQNAQLMNIPHLKWDGLLQQQGVEPSLQKNKESC